LSVKVLSEQLLCKGENCWSLTCARGAIH
jgi:hypothetical protein